MAVLERLSQFKMAVCRPTYSPVCGVSKAKLVKNRNFKEHIESHNEDNTIQFNTTRAFYLHTQHVHNHKKFTCTECTKVFSKQSNLERHIPSIHRGKSYMCEKCNHEHNINM